MTPDELKSMLEANGYQITSNTRLPNETGSQIRLASGQIVNLFDKGTHNLQGKNLEPLRKLLDGSSDALSASRSVFVVYGHDLDARTQLEAMLRRWDLKPILLDQLPSGGQTIIEKLEKYRSEASFAVVLATPDDQGHRADHHEEEMHRARQNVVLELGMMLAVLGRSRVAVLLRDQATMERPSDIQGVIYIPFKDNVQECALALAKEMCTQGLTINLNSL